VRALEWLIPCGARLLRGRYFRRGLDRAACRAIHRAAALGTLYGFAPPPPFTLVWPGRGRLAGDEYRFRSPFAGVPAAGDEARVRHFRRDARDAPDRPLVVLNPGTGAVAGVLARRLTGRLLAAGADVAVPLAPGRRRGGGAWAATVGGALSAIVRLVHENVAVEAWARRLGYRTVAAAGLGLGGTVAALLAATTTRFDAYVPMLAGAHPGRLWLPPSALARAVDGRALARAGVRRGRALARLFDPVAPVLLPPPRQGERCMVVGFRYDTLVAPPDVRALAAHWRAPLRWVPRARVELPLCAAELAAVLAEAAGARA
jgi:hypothetical protein